MLFALSVRSAYVLKLMLYITFTDITWNELRYYSYETGHVSNTHALVGGGRGGQTSRVKSECSHVLREIGVLREARAKLDTYSPVQVELRTATVVRQRHFVE